MRAQGVSAWEKAELEFGLHALMRNLRKKAA